MNLSSQKTIIDGIEIGYKFQIGKSDRKHLIVIFSGFRAHGTYDFGGTVLRDSQASILWIDDTFNSAHSYYMLADGGSDISSSINAFIESILIDMNLPKTSCTLAGFSKGGSAALFYLAKYDYPTAVVTVPQFRISDYVRDFHPGTLSPMFTNTDSDVYQNFNVELIRLIERDDNLRKNIYLITSPADIQYQTEILPHVKILERYENFNYIVTETPLVRQHDQVTRYNVPVILSLLALLAEGFSPRIGHVRNGSSDLADAALEKPVFEKDEAQGLAVGSVDVFRIVEEKLYVEGHAVFPGHGTDDYHTQKTVLRLLSEESNISFKLAQARENILNSRYYKNSYIDYSFAKFATYKYKGLDISNIPTGKYRIIIDASHDGVVKSAKNDIVWRVDPFLSFHENHVIALRHEGENAFLLKRRYDELDNLLYFFELNKMQVSESKLYIEGAFIPRGFSFPEWSSIRYHLRLTEKQTGKSKLLKLANANRNNLNTQSGDIFENQNKAYFATYKYQGIDLSGMPAGNYTTELICDFNGRVISHVVDQSVQIDK